MDLENAYKTYLSVRRIADFKFSSPFRYLKYKLAPKGLSDHAFNGFVNPATNELINSINQFGTYLFNLRAWEKTLKKMNPSEDEKFDLQIEFIDPLFLCAINCPYAIKNQFIFTAIKLLQIYLPLKNQPPILPDKKFSHKYFQKLLPKDSTSKKFYEALSLIDTIESRQSLGHSRNFAHHRIPLNFGMGLIPDIKVISEAGQKFIAVGVYKPLNEVTCLNHLHQEHAAIKKAFIKYWAFACSLDEKLKNNKPQIDID